MNTQRRFDSLLVTSGRRTTARMLTMVLSALGGAAALVALPSAALATPAALIGLHPTGVDDANVLLAPQAVDTHWTVTTTDTDFVDPKAYVYPPNVYPASGPWIHNTPTGQWLTLLTTNPPSVGPDTTTTFTTKIDLTGFDAATTSVSFDFAADNSATIWLNGADTTLSTNTYTALKSVTISAGWVAGVNTIEFRVHNAPPGKNPVGLLVSTISGTAEPDLADPDNDGLSNYAERVGGTDPTKDDTDGDGLKDGDEDKNHNGVVDAGETDPKKADTDGGGISDGVELANGGDPLDASDDNKFKDDDGDGLLNGYEVSIGTDPTKDDSDGDGLKDAAEVGADKAHPIDTDKDGTIDALDADDDGDTIPTATELALGDAGTPADTDKDGKADYLDDDDDGDTVLTINELGLGDAGLSDGGTAVDTDGDGKADYLDADDDNDTILTKDEVSDTKTAHVSDDVDGDGKKNWLDDDADGDGAKDGAEGRGDANGNGIPDYLDPDQKGTGDGGPVTGDDAGPGTDTDSGSTTTDGADSGTSGNGNTTNGATSAGGDLAGGGIACSVTRVANTSTGSAFLIGAGAVIAALGIRRRKR